MMAKRSEKSILFLCTGNYYRSRFAEIFFNSVATKLGLPWRAVSRGLALERGAGNVGPMAKSAIKELESKGIRASTEFARAPLPASPADFAKADYIVALQHSEHLPLLQERHPAWIEKTEFWDVDDVPGICGLIETEVMDLTARLLSGGRRREPRPRDEANANAPAAPVNDNPRSDNSKSKASQSSGSQPSGSQPNGPIVKVGRETKGRRGKGVTTVMGVPLDAAGLAELASQLKQRCSTGGTVKDGVIEIQGDQRDRITIALEALGYRVKRAGG
jgi:predicted translation initiation factor SUI1